MSSYFSENETEDEEEGEDSMIFTQTQFIMTQEESEINITQPDFLFSRTQPTQSPFTQIFTPIPTLTDYSEEIVNKTPDTLDTSMDDELEDFLQKIEENYANINSTTTAEPTFDGFSQLEICSLPSQFLETPTKPVQQKKEEILSLSTPSTSSSINSSFNQNFPNFSPLTDDKFLMNYWGIPNEIIHSYEELGINSLYPWQVGCLEILEVTESGENLVYSGPTGGICFKISKRWKISCF
jgi:hypothetical protein